MTYILLKELLIIFKKANLGTMDKAFKKLE